MISVLAWVKRRTILNSLPLRHRLSAAPLCSASMVTDEPVDVPVWTLATEATTVPLAGDFSAMSPERLDEHRTVLAALADTPVATLEAHPLPPDLDTSQGLPLSAASPLAKALSQFVDQTPAQFATSGGEGLYRMVAPSKVAAQVGAGLLKPMKSSAGGVHSALVGNRGSIAAQARFIPVNNGAAANLTKLAVAAPLIINAVAAFASLHAEQQRQRAIERLTELVEKLHQDRLDEARDRLDSCRSPITKATAILLDLGQIGEALGLGPAVHTIENALSSATRRVDGWKASLDDIADRPVELQKVKRLFPGINNPNGEFHVHVELARAAIALKRRVLVLQAVEQAQLNPGNTFERFVRVLQQEQSEVDELESGLNAVLMGLSQLQLDRSHGVRDFAFSSAQVDELLHATRRFRAFADGISETDSRPMDVVIDIVRATDGSVIVLPAQPATA